MPILVVTKCFLCGDAVLADEEEEKPICFKHQPGQPVPTEQAQPVTPQMETAQPAPVFVAPTPVFPPGFLSCIHCNNASLDQLQVIVTGRQVYPIMNYLDGWITATATAPVDMEAVGLYCMKCHKPSPVEHVDIELV